MRTLSYYFGAAALALAATMTSCSSQDNPIGGNGTIDEPTPGKIIIKELYFGGCTKGTTGTGKFINDSYVILYNNGGTAITANNLALGMAIPANGDASNPSVVDGVLEYENSGFTPAANGVWYFQAPLTIQPYSQVVVNLRGAIDNTIANPESVNFANADYYCTYDPTTIGPDDRAYNNTAYYPEPAAEIPTAHYLKAIKYGQGNAWALSTTSPAFFIFETENAVTDYCVDANLWYPQTRAQTPVYACQKIENKYILDGVEVYNKAKVSASNKRLPAAIDAGYVEYTVETKFATGSTVYRNVDKEATESIKANQGKLVYDYALGNDPSGIDAEASLKNGAQIVYMDTDNSTADFHERDKASIK